MRFGSANTHPCEAVGYITSDCDQNPQHSHTPPDATGYYLLSPLLKIFYLEYTGRLVNS